MDSDVMKGRCDECNKLVNGEIEGWYDHTIHGACNVCLSCSDTEIE